MPELLYPGFFPFTSGSTVDPDQWMTLVQPNTDREDSLSIVNGFLDYENIGTSGWVVGKEHTQRGASVLLEQRARTANLDWMWTDWNSFENDTPDATVNVQETSAIPGSAWSGYVPWDGYLLVEWQVFWGNDNGFNDSDSVAWRSTVILYADGERQEGMTRHVGACAETVGNDPRFYQKARFWAGHALIEVTQGWHDVGLHIIADHRIRQTRTWSSSIRVLPLKWPGGAQ